MPLTILRLFKVAAEDLSFSTIDVLQEYCSETPSTERQLYVNVVARTDKGLLHSGLISLFLLTRNCVLVSVRLENVDYYCCQFSCNFTQNIIKTA